MDLNWRLHRRQLSASTSENSNSVSVGGDCDLMVDGAEAGTSFEVVCDAVSERQNSCCSCTFTKTKPRKEEMITGGEMADDSSS